MIDNKSKIIKYILNFFIKGIYISIILGPALYFGYNKMTSEMALSIAGGAIAVALMNMDKFSKIKGAGFEAELKANKAVNKVYAKIEDMDKLANEIKAVSDSAKKAIIEGRATLINNLKAMEYILLFNNAMAGIPMDNQLEIMDDFKNIMDKWPSDSSKEKAIGYKIINNFTYKCGMSLYDVFKNNLLKAPCQSELREIENQKRNSNKYISKEEIMNILNGFRLNDDQQRSLTEYLQWVEEHSS